MFRSSFIASVFALPKDKLLTFDIMLRRLWHDTPCSRKEVSLFPTNESVLIYMDFFLSACRCHLLYVPITFEIQCCLEVTIDYIATYRTNVHPLRQVQVFLYMATDDTSFGTRIPSICYDNRYLGPMCLVFNLSAEFIKILFLDLLG